ncbi:MAG: hypothetical protein H8E44_46920 [Planctomycetes bacterium]|nr:hypothetical protein [Planctomycetota bacterium]MBL7041809.1 hypothetical protein [Pirellulaceae bacterium]
MSESPRTSGPQFRADRAVEQEAVRTTIVGGRPPGSGQSVGDIPRGIEILVKKAAVDPEFREVLLSRRAEAADEIGLKLDPAEAMMLQAAPAEQLGAVIDRTVVPQEHRRVFLGKAAAAMLAALGLAQTGCGGPAPTGSRPDSPKKPTSWGSRPDRPAVTGIEPDMPEPNEPPEDGSTEGAAEPNQAVEEPATEQPNDSPPDQTIRGIRPDRVPAPTGSRPDLPPSSEPE